jgi:hypothetical protein
LASGLVVGFVGGPGAAWAQSALDAPFSEGFALNPVEPAPAGDRFFLVWDGWTDPAAPDGTLPLRAMLFGHLTLNSPLRRTDNMTGEERDIVERQLYAHANVTVYPLERLLLNADLPIAAVQQGEGPAAPGAAVGDLRLGARVGLLGDRNSAFSLAPGVDVWVPTGSPDNLTGDGTVRVRPQVSASGKAGVFVYAANAGFLFRKRYDPGSLEIGPSLTYGAAVGLSLFDDILQVGPELAGASLVSSDRGRSFSSETTPLTALIGARVQVGDINLGVGYGPGLSDAPGTASRLFASVTFLPRGEVAADGKLSLNASAQAKASAQADMWDPADVDSDGDEISDAEDACPELLGKPSDDPAQHGCPAKPAAAPASAPAPAPPPTPAPAPAALPAVAPPPPEPQRRQVAPAPRAANGAPVATYVGFRQLGGSRVLVYVELTDAPGVELTARGRTLEYTLRRTRVTLKNNRNPLLARHFDSVVESAQLVPAGKDVKLVIQLRSAAEPVSRVVRQGSRATLEVELTPTQAAPGSKAPASAPKKP